MNRFLGIDIFEVRIFLCLAIQGCVNYLKMIRLDFIMIHSRHCPAVEKTRINKTPKIVLERVTIFPAKVESSKRKLCQQIHDFANLTSFSNRKIS